MYANFGRPSDIDFLKSHLESGSCKDSILVMRFGEISRAEKVRFVV